MTKNFIGEKWATVKFDFYFTNNMLLEVSNFGQVRTFTKLADGKLLKGSNINGYRAITLKLFKPGTAAAQKRLVYFLKKKI